MVCAMGPLMENGRVRTNRSRTADSWMNYRLQIVPRPTGRLHSTHKKRREEEGKGMKNESASQRMCEREGGAAL
jgi:hypothetical protein